MAGNATHGHTRGPAGSKRFSPTYLSWLAMRHRCCNPKASNYWRYGGRGITVCDRWKTSFAAFLEDMGERPNGMTLDRKDGKGDYEPGNCRWATQDIQNENRDKEGLRWRAKRTHCQSGHAFDDENTHVLSNGSRKCMECDRLRAQRVRDRLKEAA